MMMVGALKIENREARIYKSYCWNAYFEAAYSPCWYVLDAEGNVLEGGFGRGSNCRPGYVTFATRREAKAWALGHQDAKRGTATAEREAIKHLFPSANGHVLDRLHRAYLDGVHAYNQWSK